MILLLAFACNTQVQFPPPLDLWPDTGLFQTGLPTPVVPTSLWGTIEDASLNVECNALTPDLAMAFRTVGWADGASVLLVHSGTGASEFHPLIRVSSHPGGDSETYQLGPLATVVADDVVLGESTAFDCSTDAEFITFALLTTGRTSPYADCAAFGTSLEPLRGELDALSPDLLAQCRLSGLPF